MLCFALLCLELGNYGNGHFWKTITKGIPWILIYLQSCVVTQAMAKETWPPLSLSWLEYRQEYHNVCFLSLNYLSCLTVKPKTDMLVNKIKKGHFVCSYHTSSSDQLILPRLNANQYYSFFFIDNTEKFGCEDSSFGKHLPWRHEEPSPMTRTHIKAGHSSTHLQSQLWRGRQATDSQSC